MHWMRASTTVRRATMINRISTRFKDTPNPLSALPPKTTTTTMTDGRAQGTVVETSPLKATLLSLEHTLPASRPSPSSRAARATPPLAIVKSPRKTITTATESSISRWVQATPVETRPFPPSRPSSQPPRERTTSVAVSRLTGSNSRPTPLSSLLSKMLVRTRPLSPLFRSRPHNNSSRNSRRLFWPVLHYPRPLIHLQ